MRFLTKLWKSGVFGAFLTGLAVLAPLILTLMILQWIMARLAGAFGPGTWAGHLLARAGSAVVGPNHGVIAFFLGLSAVLVGIWALGTVAKARAQGVRGLARPGHFADPSPADGLSPRRTSRAADRRERG